MLSRVVLSVLMFLAFAVTAMPNDAYADKGDEKRFQKLVGKYLIEATEVSPKLKPKALCLCENGGFGDGELGFLYLLGGNVRCAVPTFQADGDLFATAGCEPFLLFGR